MLEDVLRRALRTNHPTILYLPQPPHDFDPATASDSELSLHGFMKRPDQKDITSSKRWLRRVSSRRIAPVLQETGFRHAPNQRVGSVQTQGVTTLQNSNNWSGAVVRFPTAEILSGMSNAMITTKVPPMWSRLSPTLADHCSIWVGFDGDGESDVCQAGVHMIGTIQQSHGGMGTVSSPAYLHYAWIEWYPNYEVQVTNLAINPGNEVEVSLTVLSRSYAQANIWNLTTNTQVSLVLTPPSGTSLTGSSIEWILERPEINDVLPSLLDFGDTLVTISDVANPGNKYLDLANLGDGALKLYNMVGSSGNTLSAVSVPAPVNNGGKTISQVINFTFQNFS